MQNPLLSVVVPLFNETENVPLLVARIQQELSEINWELIFVDDGSRDKTVATVLEEAKKDPRIILVEFTRNYGQTAAMAAGIEAARGEFIVTLDGDLQNDPKDIPAMLKKLQDENWDIVVGCRQKRQDGILLRKIPSKIANILIRRLSGVAMHDYGCTLKVFRAELAKNLDLQGELHRFIPILAAMEGARISEVPVLHHARQFGASKYGIGRTFRVVSDLLLMFFFLRYRQKPMHLFGTLGTALLIFGSVVEIYLLALKILGESIGGRPLFFVGIVMILAGIQLITTGFLAEMLTRTHLAASQRRSYRIRKIHRVDTNV